MTGDPPVLRPRSCSCHCGGVTFTAALPAQLSGIRCNCSICAAKGAVMVGVPIDGIEVTGGRDLLASYRFNTMAAEHFFCSRCGIHCFHKRRTPPDQYAVNAACIGGVDPYRDFPEIAVADGQHHAADHGGKRRMAGTLRFEENPED